MLTYIKKKDMWIFRKDGVYFSLDAKQIGEMEALTKDIREEGSAKCKNCGHDELCHIGCGCYGSFFGADMEKIDPQEIFYGECLCQNFEPIEDNQEKEK